jgi:hypothetical protein
MAVFLTTFLTRPKLSELFAPVNGSAFYRNYTWNRAIVATITEKDDQQPAAVVSAVVRGGGIGTSVI